MYIQPINNSQTNFKGLIFTKEAMQICKQEKGAEKQIQQWTNELAKSKIFDLHITKIVGNNIYPHFGKERECCVVPFYINKDVVGVYSAKTGKGRESNIVDYLKFSSAKKAEKVYNNLRNHFLEAPKGKNEYGPTKTPMQVLAWAVDAVKAFEKGKILSEAEKIENGIV